MPNAYDRFFEGQWTDNKKWDPLTHRAIELTVKQDSHNVAAIDHGISKMFGGDGSTVIGDEARKVENDPVRGVGRAALTAGAIIGAMYAAPAAGGGAGGTGAGAGTAGGTAGSGSAAWTPALIESAAGTGGYGLSSAGLGYTGPASGSGGVAAFNTAASNPALIESAVGSTGYGASSAGPGGVGAGSASAWTRYGKGLQQAGEAMQQQQRGVVQPDPVVLPSDGRRPYWEMATSSKAAKRPVTNARMGEQVMRNGASGIDPISRNGVEIGAIQALTKRLAAARRELATLEAEQSQSK